MTTRPSEVRERLLRTASALFYAEGIHAVGVDRIITEAGVTRSTFYRHFPGKEDLVVAYLVGVDQAVRELVRAETARHTGPADLLRAIASGLGDQICSPGFRGCSFINAAAEYPDPQDAVHRAVVEHRAWFAGAVEATLRDCGHPSPAHAARHLVMLRDGAMVNGYLGDPRDARDTLDRGVEGILAGCTIPTTTQTTP